MVIAKFTNLIPEFLIPLMHLLDTPNIGPFFTIGVFLSIRGHSKLTIERSVLFNSGRRSLNILFTSPFLK